MIRLFEIHNLVALDATDVSSIKTPSERKFADVVTKMPEVLTMHEAVHVKSLNSSTMEMERDTLTDFLLVGPKGVAIVEVTDSRPKNKKFQARTCGVRLSKDPFTDNNGFIALPGIKNRTNNLLPREMHYVVIGRPAINDPEQIRSCIKKVLFGD